MSETNDRAEMLEKLNAAFERATEPEEAELPEEPQAPVYEHVSHDIDGLYGGDARRVEPDDDEPDDDEHDDDRRDEHDDDDYDEDDDEWDDDEPVKKKGKAGAVIGIVLGALVLLLLAGATIVAEPWVKAPLDDYTAPTDYVTEADKTVAVGETYSFDDISLGENAAVSKVEITDSDVLSTDGVSSITGVGEYFSTPVRFEVSEKEVVPATTSKEFSLFGKDLSGPYNKIRSKLRDLVGVEKAGAQRTDLRVLGLYEMNVTVEGLSAATTSQELEASTSTSTDFTLELGANEDFRFVSGDAGQTVTFEQETDARAAYTFKSGEDTVLVVKAVVDEEDGNEYYINGKKSGALATVVAEVGFWKKVDAETYAAYLAATGQTAAASDTTTTDATTDTTDAANPHENEIFVPTRAVSYVVKVA